MLTKNFNKTITVTTMNNRKRRIIDSDLADTIIIKWETDGQYSTIKACRVISGTCKVGESVSVRLPPPDSREFIGSVIFCGTSSQCECEIKEILGENDQSLEDKLPSSSAKRQKPQPNMNAKRHTSTKLLKKAKQATEETCAANVELLSGIPAVSKKLVNLIEEETQDTIATFSDKVFANDKFNELSPQLPVSSSRFQPSWPAGKSYAPYPTCPPPNQHDCCVISFKLPQFLTV